MPRFPHCMPSAAALAALTLAVACRDEPARPPASGEPPATAASSRAHPASLPATFEARSASGSASHAAPEPLITGPMSREEIRAVINRDVERFLTCFKLTPAETPAFAGKVTVHFTIDPRGQVVDATVAESTVGKSPVASCVLETVRALQFPAPRGGGTVEVTYPFVFRPAR